MLSSPEIKCLCDGKGCHETIEIGMKWCHTGYYLAESDIEEAICNEYYGWLIIGDKHYCSSCRGEYEEKANA